MKWGPKDMDHQETLHAIPEEYKLYSLAGTSQEVQFIIDTLNLPAGSRILDLHCGYGRHALALAAKGFQVTGVDANVSFLELGSQKAQEEGIAGQIEFIQSDMRSVAFDKKFAAVINMFAAFGYFSDDENILVLQAIHKALVPNGLFLIDLLNREWMVHNSLNRYWRHPNGECVLTYKTEFKNGLIALKRQLTNLTTGKKTQFEYTLRAYSLSEMLSILSENNFLIQKVFGGFDGRPYTPDSPRMIILAQKADSVVGG